MDETKSGYFAFYDWNVWFDVFGWGPQPVLLIPGAIGTALTDFKEQLFGEYALDFNRFSLVVVETPGWGRSRPPNKLCDKYYFDRDVNCCHKIMQHLGHNEYSVIGWSHGARVALLMAAAYRQHITSIVLTGLSNRNNDNLIKYYKAFEFADSWKTEFIQTYLRSYHSFDEIKAILLELKQFYIDFPRYFGSDIFHDKYESVKCPVLIFHGDQDPISDTNDVIAISERLSDCRLHRIASAGHDLNIKFYQTFNFLSEEFILTNNKNE